MTHRDFVRPFGVWQPTAVPTAADIGAIDAGAATLVDGDNGGVWNPATPIVIGGAGFSGTNTKLSSVLTKSGGRLYLPATGYPSVSSVTSRRVQVDLVRACGNFGGTPNGLTVSLNPFGVQPTIQYGMGFAFAIPKRYLHNGGTLSTITLNGVIRDVGIPFTPTASPFHVAPSVSLIVSDVSGGIVGRSDLAARPWKASTVYANNTYVRATQTKTDGYLYSCGTHGGTSGATEPAWPGNPFSTVTDNTITWQGSGFTGQIFNTLATSLYSSGSLSPMSIPLSVGPWIFGNQPYNVIDTSKYEYTIQVKQDSLAIQGVVFTSLQLDYSATPGLSPE